jgi:hypothetical protein
MSISCEHFSRIVYFPTKPFAVKVDRDVSFSWGASTGTVDGYRIYWGTICGGPYPFRLCDVEENILEYVTALASNKEHYLICRAYNDFGESGNSNEVRWPRIK